MQNDPVATRSWTSSDQRRAVRSTYDLIREIDRYSDKLLKTMVYFVFLSVYVVIIVIWAFLGFSPIREWWLFWTLMIYAGFLVMYFPAALWNGIRLIRPLKRWIDDMSETLFIAAFELLPARGDTPMDRILNQISDVYTDIPKLVQTRPRAIRRDTGLGKRKSVRWDVVVDLTYPRFFRIFSSPEYLLVKRFASDKEIGVEEIRSLVEGTLRDLRWSGASISEMFIVSTKNFSNEAIAYIEDLQETKPYGIEPVVETATGFFLPIKPD